MRSEKEKEYLLKAMDALKRDVLIISPGFRIIAANRHSTEKWPHRLVGQTCHRLIHGRETPCEDCPAAEAIRTGEMVIAKEHIELTTPSKKAACFPIFDGPHIDAVVMTDYDISRLGSVEEKLDRANTFLRNILRSAVDGVMGADMHGKVILFNEVAAEITGYKVAEALESLHIWQIYPGEGRHDAREVMRQLRGSGYGGPGKLKRYHVDIVSKSGERIPISLYAALVYEENREIASVGFFHDLRDRLRIKEELEQTQMQLLQAAKMASLGKLAAGVAHQLNNPLGSITLFAQLLLEEHELDEPVQADIQRILTDAERCRDTVRELLEFAHQSRHEMGPQDVNRALGRTLFLLEKQTLFHNIEIERRFAEELPPVYADARQINHLMMNLILNAAQAMQGRGRLTLRTGMAADGRRVEIGIGDTGPGIPEDVRPYIFEPFFTTKDPGSGTGLGLSIAYSIVQNHNGDIRVDSDPERGTTFTVTLPTSGPEDKGAQGD